LFDLVPDNIYYEKDTRQIYSLRWNPWQRQWLGRIKSRDGYDTANIQGSVKHEITLDENWVTENFDESVLEACRIRSTKKRCYLPVPPGNSKEPMDCNAVDDRPTVFYQQGKTSSCATSGMASALHYLGYHEDAKRLYDLGVEWLKTENAIRIMEATAEWISNKSKLVKNWRIRKLRNDALSREAVLRDGMVSFLFLQLLGSDGSVGHSVTIYCGHIFDANNVRALPLNGESLDYCCSSKTGTTARMTRVFKGYVLEGKPTGRRICLETSRTLSNFQTTPPT
jgi:hypothetical protein